jgi:hypothetical protein
MEIERKGAQGSAEYFRIHDWWDYSGSFLRSRYKHNESKWMKIRELYVKGARHTKNRDKNGSKTTTPTQPTNLPTQTHPPKPTYLDAGGSGLNGSGSGGSGSGGVGNLGAAMARENGAIEKIVGIKRLLVAAGVNETIHGEFTSRRDLNETIVTNEIEDIKRDPKAELPAVLVSRLRKKRYQ